ncbi:group II intron maturase-specific domain-containing protein [Ruminiclostridium cellulolyticum]|uniref:group II intron maturase-specific domain-containing protein n=1 Tax=Ruminiclostridium cellulolyticum TaxID=1521 RepID=UPI0000E9A028
MRFRVHEKSVKKLKSHLKELTGRSRTKQIDITYTKIKKKMVGWINYFKLADMKKLTRYRQVFFAKLDLAIW